MLKLVQSLIALSKPAKSAHVHANAFLLKSSSCSNTPWRLIFPKRTPPQPTHFSTVESDSTALPHSQAKSNVTVSTSPSFPSAGKILLLKSVSTLFFTPRISSFSIWHEKQSHAWAHEQPLMPGSVRCMSSFPQTLHSGHQADRHTSGVVAWIQRNALVRQEPQTP